jgi:hypothetical protein
LAHPEMASGRKSPLTGYPSGQDLCSKFVTGIHPFTGYVNRIWLADKHFVGKHRGVFLQFNRLFPTITGGWGQHKGKTPSNRTEPWETAVGSCKINCMLPPIRYMAKKPTSYRQIQDWKNNKDKNARKLRFLIRMSTL